MKIYTKKGDQGLALSNDGLKQKNDLFFELLGTIDEVQSLIGVVYETIKKEELNNIKEELLLIMNIKYQILSAFYLNKDLEEDYSLKLEKLIDLKDSKLKPLNAFILPIGTLASANAHLARVVSRRLERVFYEFLNKENIDVNVYPNIAKYLNRLSDYLFMLARELGEK